MLCPGTDVHTLRDKTQKDKQGRGRFSSPSEEKSKAIFRKGQRLILDSVSVREEVSVPVWLLASVGWLTSGKRDSETAQAP